MDIKIKDHTASEERISPITIITFQEKPFYIYKEDAVFALAIDTGKTYR